MWNPRSSNDNTKNSNKKKQKKSKNKNKAKNEQKTAEDKLENKTEDGQSKTDETDRVSTPEDDEDFCCDPLVDYDPVV